MEKITTFEDFTKIDIRVGTVIKVDSFPEANKQAYKLTINFGSLGSRKTSAQITFRYKLEQLLDLQVIAIVNLKNKQIANTISNCLILGAVNNDDVILLKPEQHIPNGSSVH